MKRIRRTLLFLSALLIPLAALSATDVADDEHVGPLPAEVLEVIWDLLQQPGLAPVSKDHGNGLHSATIALPSSDGENLIEAGDGSGASFSILGVGRILISPATAGDTLVPTCFRCPGFGMNYWWAVANTSNSFRTARSTRKLRGPGLSFKRDDVLSYGSNAITILWDNIDQDFTRTGIHKQTVTVQGAGKGKGRFLVVFVF